MSENLAEQMIRIRLSQILINEEYKAGRFKVPVHLAMGHEAIATAVSRVLDVNDKLVLTHRNIAYHLARIGKIRPMLDEYLLASTGVAQGKLGSMNVINPEKNIIYSSSILGNGFPVSAGIAMEEKTSGRNGAVFVLGGDGSMEEGSFYESLGMAKTLGLPWIAIIENNEWSLGTKISERRCPIDLDRLASSFDIPYHRLYGNNAQEYIDTLTEIHARALAEGPQCVEVEVSTLGDWRGPQTPEFPEGKYINYHAGPSPSVDVVKHASRCILKEDEKDPIYVVAQEMGDDGFTKMSERILNELIQELA